MDYFDRLANKIKLYWKKLVFGYWKWCVDLFTKEVIGSNI